MKTVKKIVAGIIILILFLLLMLLPGEMGGQTLANEYFPDYAYFNANLDVNKAMGLIDNPRTEQDVRGADFDLEAGVRFGSHAIYMHWGAFQERNYQSYGAGYDYFVNWLSKSEAYAYNPFGGQRFRMFKGVDLSAGADISIIMRKDRNGNWGGSFPQLGIRGQSIFWITETFGFVLKAKGQPRPDIGKFMIFEGDMGIIINLKSK